MKGRKRSWFLVGGVLILALALGITVAFAQTTGDPVAAQDSGETPPFHPWGRGGRGFGGHSFGGQLEGVTPLHELIAAELDVTVEALQNALAEAHSAAMAEDAFGFHGHHGFEGSSEFESYLADALAEIGVTVEEFQAAQEAARATWLEEMVAAGYLTADQAALIEAHQALKEYIDREALLAGVLGLSLEELQSAREAGTPLSELLGDMTFQEFAAAMQEAYADAVQQAADDGIISDEQAEQILSDGLYGPGLGGPGFGYRGFHGGGPGGFHGHGGFRGFGSPGNNANTNTGLNI